MKVVAFVPIKLNNERFPNKNIIPLGGRPLCQHLLSTVSKVPKIDNVYVFCSDEAIRQYLPAGVTFLKREEALDGFETRHYDIVDSFVSKIDADIYVNVHVTNPFIKQSSIEKGVDAILSGEYDCAIGVSEIREHMWYEGEPFNFTREDPPRTQDLTPYMAEVGVFMYTKDVYLKTGTRYGKNPYFIILDKVESTDINYKDDHSIAEALYQVMREQTDGQC